MAYSGKKSKNLFSDKTETELLKLYKQFIESEKTLGIPDNELGKMRDRYIDMCGANGVLIMTVDLTRTISDIWYNQNRVEENEEISIDEFVEQINSAYDTAIEKGFDSIVLAIDTDLDSTYYINDTSEGFQCDLIIL